MKPSIARTDIAQRIKELRTSHNLTRAQLADMLGLSSQGSIGNWESGIASPDCDKLFLLANIFGVDLNYLFGFEAEQKLEKQDGCAEGQDDLLRRFSLCDEIGQETILACVQHQYERCVSKHYRDRPQKAKRTNDAKKVFLSPDDIEYTYMLSKVGYLCGLKNSTSKSFLDILHFLWDLGYGADICLKDLLCMFGKGEEQFVPSESLYDDVEAFLKGKYVIICSRQLSNLS